MKILLITPPQGPKEIGGTHFNLYEPIALEYLAATVKDYHSVSILDMRIDQDLIRTLEEVNPDLAGITGYTVNVNMMKALCKRIKEWNPEIRTIIGGHHATVAPEDFTAQHIDFIAIGDGIETFPEFIKALDTGKDIRNVKGLAFVRNNRLLKNPSRPLTHINDFPMPDRTLTEQYREHYFCDWMQPLACINTSRGCPFRCKFCSLWKLTGGRYMTRHPESIVEELSGINEKYIFLSDDESMVDHKRMMNLADIIKKSGIKKSYYMYGRADTIARHPELMEKWKNIGLERVFVGFESYRNKDLKDINKQNSIEDHKKAVDILRGLDISIYASLMILPEYDHKNFEELYNYVQSLKLEYPVFSILTPLKGSDLYEELKHKLVSYDFDTVDFFHPLLPTRLPVQEFCHEIYNLYKRTWNLSAMISVLCKYPPHKASYVLKTNIREFKRIGESYRDCEPQHSPARKVF